MQKRLVKKEKKIAGVCGGLGHYFDIDPTIVRVLFLAALLMFGTGLLLYIILAIVMPEDTTGNS
ncbi:MAG TPA: PspC domain-containing protein [Bacteroidia bacterium]|nr:PspC domain-containing protein [Bacteroidia bacterium]HNS11721.1 PspC domain-containing protein [Bacteroidia bacterium]